MAEFTPINTQEEFDNAIKARIERERKSLLAQYADYDSLKTQIAQLEKTNKDTNAKYEAGEKTISELQAKVQSYETDSVKTRMALKYSIPFELAGRLSGTTEEEIEKDAQTLAGFVSKKSSAPPLAGSNDVTPTEEDIKKDGYKELLKAIKGDK
ncbi:MAG: DUF4355 domain-containing protein [Oscillospiraceae bacterium]|nr:DUF4355 domain-containing protein [Oscillospiraceae bacterium]